MKRCITYSVYMASHTGLLTGTSICRFMWVVQKHMGRQDAGGDGFFCVVLFLSKYKHRNWFSSLSLCWNQKTVFNATSWVCHTNALKTNWTGYTNEGYSSWPHAQTPSKDQCMKPKLLPRNWTCPHSADKFSWCRAENLQLRFTLCRGDTLHLLTMHLQDQC